MRAEAVLEKMQPLKLWAAFEAAAERLRTAVVKMLPHNAPVRLNLAERPAASNGRRVGNRSKRTGRRRKSPTPWQSALAFVQRMWAASGGRVVARVSSARSPRRLRLCEAVPLGDKRFVAVVQFERNRFLIGGAPNSVVLLTRLDADGNAPFTEALAIAQQGHA
jgi:Flagellar biosynthesis protein, FliO